MQRPREGTRVVQRGAVHQVRKLLKVLGEQAVRAQLQVDGHAAPRADAPPARGHPRPSPPALEGCTTQASGLSACQQQ